MAAILFVISALGSGLPEKLNFIGLATIVPLYFTG